MYYAFEKRNTPFFATTGLSSLSPIPHIHTHLELIYLTEGQSSVTADNATMLLRAGDLFLSFPNQIHYYDGASVKGVLIIVSPELFPELSEIFSSKLPASPIIKKELLPHDIYELLNRICACRNAAETLHKIAANGYMQGLLAELIGSMTLMDTQSRQDNVREILIYCIAHYKEDLSLDVLAEELHLSKFYISHIFSDRLSISFTDFINGLRIESACRHLDKGGEITDAAFESGFRSIRSFNRNFKRSTGITPSEYINRNNIRASK